MSRGVRVFFGKHEWIIGLGINGQLSKRTCKGLTNLFNDLVHRLLIIHCGMLCIPWLIFTTFVTYLKKTIGVIHARRQ